MFRKRTTPQPLAPSSIHIGDSDVPVIFRRHAQARRLVLRLNPEATAVTVTVPHGVSRTRALDFAARSSDWIARRLAVRGGNVALRAGSVIPLRGVDHAIAHVPTTRGVVIHDETGKTIRVAGELPHLPRRLADWLKRAARADLADAVDRYAAAMEVSYRRISLRDQKSRWGSCSSTGELSFSWRLIFAPPFVLDYVAAHEVAHLRHMDHSPRFWRLVLTQCPDASRAKTWLKSHGQDVHRIVL